MSGKMFKILVLAAAMVLTCAFGSWAKPVEPADARMAAENWIDYIVRNDGSWGEFRAAEAVKIEPFFVEGEKVGFVIDVAPLGFVLVPADDELPPIKAYSTDSFFNQDAGGFSVWVGAELKKVMVALRAESSSKPVFMPVNARLWKWLREEYRAEAGPTVSAIPAPLLTTTVWDQMDPYNRFCPEFPEGSGSKCPVGCVATATIQVMRYWSWPPQGTGSHSYTSQTHRFKLSADFNHAYNWSNMPDSLGLMATESQKDEVARLGSDLGIAYEMDYDPEGSGAYTDEARYVLPQYFFYSDEIQFSSYAGVNDETEWFNLFKEEVDAGRPALMSIRGPDGGHAVVCDGYRTDQGNMIHLNFGWGGWATAYYAPNSIKNNSFDLSDIYSQEIIRNITPNENQSALAAAAATPMGGKAPVTVSFAGQGKKGVGPYTYSWNFGDGSTGEGQFPTHIYNEAGAFTVTLTATDTISQIATDSHLTINVTGGTGVSAAASANVTSGQVPLIVVFTGVAQGGTTPYTYSWTFGDGASESTSNTSISHTYTASGTYTAVLTVKDSKGAQATASGVTISAQPATPRPTIQLVSKLTSPFRLKVTGTNFIEGSEVKINGVAVSQTLFKSATKLVAKGADVKTMCPKGVTVQVTVENESGNVSDPVNFTR